jgi:hypothetical protein
MNKKLDRIEARLQNLIEEKLVEAITGRRPNKSLVEELVITMQDNLKELSEDSVIAPDQYIIHVNPQDLLNWQTHQKSLDQLAALLQKQGELEGFRFSGEPSITILSDPNTPINDYSISVYFSHKEPSLPDTTAMPLSHQAESSNQIPEGAYLIIQGSKSFPLEKAVVNIGRHSNNDLALNDPHISRHHAQLRGINGHYVLFDIGSTGGLLLNGKKIPQGTLQSGDVIRLGTTNLIYVQESISNGPTTAFPIDNESRPS